MYLFTGALSNSDDIPSNYMVITEELIRMNVEGRGRSIINGTALIFLWGTEEVPKTRSV